MPGRFHFGQSNGATGTICVSVAGFADAAPGAAGGGLAG